MQINTPLRELENANEFVARHMGLKSACEKLMINAIVPRVDNVYGDLFCSCVPAADYA